MNETITSPFSTATPESAMKPTPAEIESGMPRSQSASDAAGERERHAGEDERRVLAPSRRSAKSSPKISSSASGTTTCRRAAAEASCSNCRPSRASSRPAASTSAPMRAAASATNEPRSRPRTFAVTTTRRLPFSRLIWFGPGASSSRATAPSGTKLGHARRWCSRRFASPCAIRQRDRQALERVDVRRAAPPAAARRGRSAGRPRRSGRPPRRRRRPATTSCTSATLSP